MRPELYCPICYNKDDIELKDDIYTCSHCGVFKIDEKLRDFVGCYKVDKNWRLKIRYIVKKHFLETKPNGFDLYKSSDFRDKMNNALSVENVSDVLIELKNNKIQH